MNLTGLRIFATCDLGTSLIHNQNQIFIKIAFYLRILNHFNDFF